ncbi:hypothetical protein KFK09_026708 [Dendrobium nobile]|uniref:Uncharacterized protein n=1 Tax=Dendrobium nobile TaxID=94219 RepID=A0A8T3A7A3_DENNO|nr:hypothetical protein KFK09_026708 [Dendrobium nobile]
MCLHKRGCAYIFELLTACKYSLNRFPQMTFSYFSWSLNIGNARNFDVCFSDTFWILFSFSQILTKALLFNKISIF